MLHLHLILLVPQSLLGLSVWKILVFLATYWPPLWGVCGRLIWIVPCTTILLFPFAGKCKIPGGWEWSLFGQTGLLNWKALIWGSIRCFLDKSNRSKELSVDSRRLIGRVCDIPAGIEQMILT
jgi:hypothetical protein